MRFLIALALAMSLAMSLGGAAQAFTLFETEPNDCACEATPGGTIATSLLSGVLTDGDFDYYRFDFAEAVPVFTVRPLTPGIGGDDAYRIFDLAIFADSEFGFPLALCEDCWFEQGEATAYDLPAGTYYVAIADYTFGELPLAGPALAGQIEPGTLGLGAYSVQVSANSVTTPEPASMALLAAGIAALAWRRRTA